MKQSKWPGSGWVELHWSGTQNKFTANLQIGENTMWTWGSFQATRVGSVKILRSCLVCFCFAVFETESFCVQAGFEHAILPMLALNSWLLCLAFPSAGLIAVWAIRSHYVTGHSKQRESCYGNLQRDGRGAGISYWALKTTERNPDLTLFDLLATGLLSGLWKVREPTDPW